MKNETHKGSGRDLREAWREFLARYPREEEKPRKGYVGFIRCFICRRMKVPREGMVCQQCKKYQEVFTPVRLLTEDNNRSAISRTIADYEGRSDF